MASLAPVTPRRLSLIFLTADRAYRIVRPEMTRPATKTTPEAIIKCKLRRIGLRQNAAAARIGRSAAMVSMVLNRKATSRPILRSLASLIRRREAAARRRGAA